ncbi:polyprenyl synthetase family protein [Microbacterium testaceum]|uniref:polyprenyl synthetase family protein n=1 Tax=Microbacterium testaceum TaxID=2033 RepID=UPI0022E8C5F2|nr:polyprenyl synthetase family protein [Microbacterium testaceum]
MIFAVPSAPTARQEIEDAIETSLERLEHRLLPLGDGAHALASAIRRATTGGKRFRPLLVAAAYDTLDGDGVNLSDLWRISAAFELLHTAFVVHDDVIDHDLERRGIPNVGGEFRQRGLDKGADETGASLLGTAAGILAGDLLLHEATRLVALSNVPAEMRADLVTLVEDAVIVSTAGELADVENSITSADLDPMTILQATRDKTAVYSFSAPLQAGAVMAGADDATLHALERFGERLGLAYQLIDDLIGAFGSPEVSGKDEGCDLREAKKTHLISLARETASWPEVSEALAQAHTGPVAIRVAQTALANSGARKALERLVYDTLDEAVNIVSMSTLPTDCKTMLIELVDMVAERVP